MLPCQFKEILHQPGNKGKVWSQRPLTVPRGPSSPQVMNPMCHQLFLPLSTLVMLC